MRDLQVLPRVFCDYFLKFHGGWGSNCPVLLYMSCLLISGQFPASVHLGELLWPLQQTDMEVSAAQAILGLIQHRSKCSLCEAIVGSSSGYLGLSPTAPLQF